MKENKLYTKSELKILNSIKGLELLLNQKNNIQPDKVLRFIKYENELKKLQVKLIKLQSWVIKNNKRVCILFEGRDAAGKGGAIRRITHHLNPRYYKVIALPKPSEIERGQWYFQRYVNHLPNPGYITFFDRSWYNRAVVEPVNNFCSNAEYECFMNEVNGFESMLTNNGLILLKYYFSISKQEQEKRFNEIKNNPLKRWKMSDVDRKAQDLWDEYTKYKLKMFQKTNVVENPWNIIEADKKTIARIAVIKDILKNVDYKNNAE